MKGALNFRLKGPQGQKSLFLAEGGGGGGDINSTDKGFLVNQYTVLLESYSSTVKYN